MEYKYVLYEKKGHTAIVTINRPEVMNALHYPANEELFDVWSDFIEDPEVWTGIITGAPCRAFCAGSDIKYMATVPRVASPEREAPDSRIQEGGFVHREIWKPVIAAVDGYCLGGGLEIAMACDIIIASSKSLFGQPEIKNVGSYPSSGGIHRLPRQMPLKIAMYMLLTGDFITADEAYRVGLINKIVPSDQVMAEAMAMADRINERSPIAARMAKEMVMKSLDLPLEYPDNQGLCAWDLERLVGAKLRASKDYQAVEGPRSFVEKRKPDWKDR